MSEEFYTKLRGAHEKVVVTWGRYQKLLGAFVKHMIPEHGVNCATLSGVYGRPRGGLVLATHLANVYNLPLLAAPARGCLIVDDLIDEGFEMQKIKAKYLDDAAMGCYCFVLFINEERKVYVNHPRVFWSSLKKPKQWIVFPWEKI